MVNILTAFVYLNINNVITDIGSFDDITCILAILNTHSVDGDVQFAAFALLGALKPAGKLLLLLYIKKDILILIFS